MLCDIINPYLYLSKRQGTNYDHSPDSVKRNLPARAPVLCI